LAEYSSDLRAARRARRDTAGAVDDADDAGSGTPSQEADWKQQFLEHLLATTDAFERLSGRLLREAGFTSVVVTGKTNDGGIDGRGILRDVHRRGDEGSHPRGRPAQGRSTGRFI
jgi:restriction system protein